MIVYISYRANMYKVITGVITLCIWYNIKVNKYTYITYLTHKYKYVIGK